MLSAITSRLPGIAEPKTHLSFKSRLKWTAIVLFLFLLMGNITLFGVSPEAMGRFAFLEMILGSSFGTLVTLGIGPIVSASIILQLLIGSKIIPWDLKTEAGRKKFQGTQKLMVIFFCVFEAYAFVAFGAIQAVDTTSSTLLLLIGQIAFGGFIILLMDEVVSKWGIGSGVSLFIAAGVTKGIFIRALNPLTPLGETMPSGLIPQFFALLGIDPFQAVITLLPLFATILVFVVVVYAQAIKVEIPLAFGSIRGFSRRWPLNLIYTNVIPIILTTALLANLQLVGSMLTSPTEEGLRCGILGCFDSNGNPSSGLAYYLHAPSSLSVQIFFLIFLAIIFVSAFLAFYFRYRQGTRVVMISAIIGLILAIVVTNGLVGLPTLSDSLRAVVYMMAMIMGATIFSIFWVSTSGMDARSVAEQIEGMGMQIPGFRRDPRIVEQVLNRYIPTLAIISGVFIGLLASLANFTGALGTGTGILLTVMIVYNLYEQISMRYTEDMHPALRKFFR